MTPLTNADARKIYEDAQPVPKRMFREANQSLVRLIQGAKIQILQSVNAKVEQAIQQATAEAAARLAADIAEKTARLKDGKTPTTPELLAIIKPLIPEPVHGKTPTKEDLLALIQPLVPPPAPPGLPGAPGAPGKDAPAPDIEKLLTLLEERIPSLGIAISDALALLPEEDRPHISLLKGLDDYLSKYLQKSANYGGSAVLGVMLGGVMKNHAATSLNFKGTGAPTVVVGPNGVTDLVFAASSGSVTVETPVGTVNGSNAQFTPTSQPKWVVADGTTYYEGAGYTWDGTHINMTIAPSEYIRDII